MNVLLIGGPGFPHRAIADAFVAAGHAVAYSREVASSAGPRADELANARRKSAPFDVTIDLEASSDEDVRVALATLGALAGHYVLVSGCEVFPNLPRTSPWREDEPDLTDDEGLASLPARVRGLRLAEREVRLAAREAPWTILRPAIVEGADEPDPRAMWFVARIHDGGPMVLPAGTGPLYRHVSADDLGRALVAISARKEAFSRTLHVAGEGPLSTWGHAAMLMDGLDRRVHFAYVPADEWQAQGLSLPYDDVAHAAFVETSPLLFELGFETTDELAFVHPLARELSRGARAPDAAVREKERALARRVALRPSSLSIGERRATPPPTRQWRLTGEPGSPATLRLETTDDAPKLVAPVLRTRRVALSTPERLVVCGELPSEPGRRVLGHDALLEIVEPGPSGLAVGSLQLPLATLPCDSPGCARCREPEALTLGIDADGFAARFVHVPAEHLAPVPPEAAPFALLAHPLAALEGALSPHLRRDAHVWISGRGVEATLASWLCADAGAVPIHVDRIASANGRHSMEAIEQRIVSVRHSRAPAPALVVELGGSSELLHWLASAVAPDGAIAAWHRPRQLETRVKFVTVPKAAPSRAALLSSLQKLIQWNEFRDLVPLVGPALPPALFWDAFVAPSFSLPVLEERS